jgi:mono/diheme cytochrome c family protein
LTHEPAALTQLAAAGGETGKRASALLARLTWPGKPVDAGAAPAAVPLTPAELKRMDEGKTIYTSLCMACHQENGQGLDKVAPSLVGSTLGLAAPHVPARILLNGKEGPIGLMPPLGAALTDDQIAAVLTYVRRAWGNLGSAVDAASVADIRKQTTGRTRPWTEKELLEMVGK